MVGSALTAANIVAPTVLLQKRKQAYCHLHPYKVGTRSTIPASKTFVLAPLGCCYPSSPGAILFRRQHVADRRWLLTLLLS